MTNSFYSDLIVFKGSESMSGRLQERGLWGVYSWTNEQFSGTLPRLKELPQRGNTLIGVSGLFNLALYLARENKGIRYVVNIDPAQCYPIFWDLVGQAFQQAHNPKEFESILVPALNSVKSQLFAERRYLLHQTDFKDSTNFEQIFPILHENILQTQEQFDKLKALFVEGRFAYVPIDLADANKAFGLIEHLQGLNYAPDILYVSNVGEYISKAQQKGFHKSITDLSSNNTAHILDSITCIAQSHSGTPLLKQRLNGRTL